MADPLTDPCPGCNGDGFAVDASVPHRCGTCHGTGRAPKPPTPPITDAELDAMEARAAKATEGPWEAGRTLRAGVVGDAALTFDVEANVFPPLGESGPVAITNEREHVNAAFIARARTDVPRLVAEVRRLNRELDTAASVYRGACADRDEARARAEKAEGSERVMAQWTNRLTTLARALVAALPRCERCERLATHGWISHEPRRCPDHREAQHYRECDYAGAVTKLFAEIGGSDG